MFIKEYEALDTSGRKRIFVDAKCQVCDVVFTRQKRLFKTAIISCSIKCNNIAKGRTQLIECQHCNKAFLRATSKVSQGKSGLNFCSRECKEAA